jgi:hypothetical protein
MSRGDPARWGRGERDVMGKDWAEDLWQDPLRVGKGEGEGDLWQDPLPVEGLKWEGRLLACSVAVASAPARSVVCGSGSC